MSGVKEAGGHLVSGRDEGGAGRMDVLKLLTTVTTAAGTQPYVLTVSGSPAGFPAAAEIFRRALQTFQPLP